MLDESSQNSIYTDGDFNQLPSLDDLRQFDMGKYTMRLVNGTDRLYKIKTDRSSKLLEIMATYRQENRFCDVVLCVNEERIPAHRVVLASASSYFASMFGQLGHIEARTMEAIDLTKLLPCPKVVQKIVDFIYTSQVQLNDQFILPLLKCSLALLLDDLIELCIAYLHDQLHPSNCIGLFLYGKQYQCSGLVEKARLYILEHFEDVVRHEEFLSLNLHDLCAILKDDKVKVTCETIVYNAAMLWVRDDIANRRDELEKLLRCIRLELLDPSFIREAMNCDDFSFPEMKPCLDYLSNIHQNLTSHRCCSLSPPRAPIKPLVIYCAGGYNNKSISMMECYFIATQVWKRCADLQVPRNGVGVVSLHMRVYVIGGRHNTKNENKDCRDVERYDPFMNKWTSMPPMNYARNRLGVGIIDHFIYAVGGSSGQQLYASVERFCPKPNQEIWVEVAPMHKARIGLAVCTHSRLLYAIGGFDGERRLVDVESYDPDQNIWKQEEPLRIARSGAAAATLAQYIYVVGGYTSDNTGGPMQLDIVERYDTINQQWSTVRPMNCRRSALSCITLDNRLFAIGGYDGNNFSSVVEVYDPEKDQWTYGKPLTRQRSGHGCALTVEPSLDTEN